MSAALPASLHLRIDVPAEVRVGETVPITLRLENVGDRPLDLYLRGRTIAFDVSITHDDGRAVWRRLAGEIVPAIIQHLALGAGEVLDLRAMWDQQTDGGEPVEPGVYVAQGLLLTDAPDPIATDPVRLRIAAS